MTNAPRVAIVGGGLAGLAAAVALVENDCHVELLESRRKLGGRAGSYVDHVTGQNIDHCQHVAMGCCTNFLDFCRRTNILNLLRRDRTLHFFGPDAQQSDFHPAAWLPAPLHLLRPLLALKYLSLADKLAIGRALFRLARSPVEHDEPVFSWLHRQRQSATSIERFWKVVLVSALAESLDRASLSAARKVFVDGFMAHRHASDVLIPRVPLDELYDQRVADWLRDRGAIIHLGTPVDEIIGAADCAETLRFANGTSQCFDFIVAAVPWHRLSNLLSPPLRAAIDPGQVLANFPSSPISSVHLWFDRALTDLPHAVLVDRLSQWVFAREQQATAIEHYYQIVISASRDLAGRDRQSIIEEVVADLRAIFPRSQQATLLRWQLITEQQAVFSVRPGLDALRPQQATSVANLLLAGDWTNTGWPATMEGAVRSGYLAAEAILSGLGQPRQIVAPDLPRSWILASR